MSTLNKQFAFVIDLGRCIGCDTCVVGCKMENTVPLGQFRLKVYDSQHNFQFEKPVGRYPDLSMSWLPTMCHHCSDAPCVRACPTGTLWRREADGVVVLDRDKCIGCQRCGEECPYDALSFDPELGTADKCDLCAHRHAESRRPICEMVCPTRAIHFGDINDPVSNLNRQLGKRSHQVLNAGDGTRPNIHYLAP